MSKEKSTNTNASKKTEETDPLEELDKELQQAIKQVEKVKDKDVVLVLGNTGSGKSTSVNYLLGVKLHEVQKGTEFVVKAINKKDALTKIGHGTVSLTQYPIVAENLGQSQFCYCDCPGFEDTRGGAVQIAASVSTEYAVKAARSIQAILIVIDARDISNRSGGKSFLRLSFILSKLFKKWIVSSIRYILLLLSLIPDSQLRNIECCLKALLVKRLNI